MLNMMQASRVPLERYASSNSRYGQECDMSKAWLTDEKFEVQMDSFNTRVDRSMQLAEEGDFGGAVQLAVPEQDNCNFRGTEFRVCRSF
jgi:hypothetical protein